MKITNSLRHDSSETSWRRILFSLVVLAYAGWLTFINALMFLPALGWLPNNALSAMGHFRKFLSTGDTHDLIHELVFALIVGTAAVGLLSQLWRPKENFAGQLVALIAWVAMTGIAALTNNRVPQPLFITFGGLTLLATILHPARLGLFNWIHTVKVNKMLFALIIIAAIPLLSFAVTNIDVQRSGINTEDDSGELLNLFGHKIPKHGDSKDMSAPANIEAVRQKYTNYTVAQAKREGYILDQFCLNAESFDQSAKLGSMGYHATNESLLRGPIAVERPQALLFDAGGRVLGVEYEVMTDAVSEPPQLFGQTFKKLPPHPGVDHEHYALHVWFVDNPSGQFADFNPNVSCPPGSAPSVNSGLPAEAPAQAGGMAMDGEAGHDNQKHIALGHYRNIAALSFIIILLGILASFRPRGWRFAAWVSGLLPILLGVISLLLPNAESSLGTIWSFVAIIWGIVFIAVAEVTRRKELKGTQKL